MFDFGDKTSTTKRGLNGVLWNFSGSIIQIISQFIIIGILARLLSPEDFGIVAIIMILVNFTSLFTHLGIGSALIQLPKISKQHIKLGYTLSLIIGLSLGIFFYFYGSHLATFFDVKDANEAIQFFAIFFPLNSVSSISNAILSRKLKFSIIVKSGIVTYIVGIGLTSIVLANLGYGYWALIIGQFVGVLFTLAILSYFQRPTFSYQFDKKIISELLFFGAGHTIGTVLNYFAENADNIIVGKNFGTISMGIYSKAFQLFSIPASFFGQIYDKVLFPILAQKQEKKELLKRFYLLSNSLCFGILFPIATLLFINAKLIVIILLGDQWLETIGLFQILIFGLAYRFGTRINKSYLTAMGIVYRGAYYQFIFALLMFTFCIVGGHYLGLKGIAWGVFFATVINYFQMSFRLYKELNFLKSNFYKIHFKTLLFYLPFFVITLLLYQFEIDSIWIHLFLTIFIYLPAFALIVINKNNIIFNYENSMMIRQITKSLPNAIQEKLKRLKKFNANYMDNN